MTAIKWQQYFNHRLLAMIFLGFASGLPLPLISSTLQAWYTVAGVPLLTIGILSLTQQPYTYKPFWAPFMDRFVPFRGMGRRRSWIISMQFCVALSLVAMTFFNPIASPWLLAGLALVVAFFSASQDIAIDAYRTDVLSVSERGMGAANYNLGWRMANITSGAVALIIAATASWQMTYILMAGLMLASMLMTWWAPAPQQEAQAPVSLKAAIVEPLQEFLTRQNALIILVFIILYKLCDALALALNTTFLIRGVGFSLVEIGTIAKVIATVSVLIGSMIGGVLMPRLGLYRSLMVFGVFQAFSNLGYAMLAIVGKNYMMMGASMAIEYFCSGLSSVAFIVFLTSLCDHRYSATQYALFSSIAAIARVFVGPVAAVMVERMGWAQFYVWTTFIGIPALFILWWLRYRVDFAGDKIVQAG